VRRRSQRRTLRGTRGARAAALGLAIAVALLPEVAAARRVVLVGIDGGSWNAIDPLLAAGELPNLAALAASGVHAELDTVEPVISPVVWTSIATGVAPGRHGIQHFLATRLDLATPTIFERLAAQGHRVGLYDWLVMWPPPVLERGFVVPGWLRRDATVTPADLWTRAGVTPWMNSYQNLRMREAYLENARSELAEKPPRFRRLVERFDCDVAAVVFYGVDAVSHRFWRASYASDVAAMKLLVLRGADPSIPTTRLFSRRGPEDPQAGADKSGLPVIPIGGPGATPLHAAAGPGYAMGFAGNSHHYAPGGMLPAVRYLVEELGADVNAVDPNGNTVVHNAAARGDTEMIRYLVSKGADVKKVNRAGQTTIDVANGPVQRTQPYPETIKLLESLGAVNNHKCVSC